MAKPDDKMDSQRDKDRRVVISLLQTPEGEVLLRYMQDMYDGDAMFDVSSATLTSYRLGRREVYREFCYLAGNPTV